MGNMDLQKLVDKAGEMALRNLWGENAYKINTMILHRDPRNTAACTRLAKYHRLNGNIEDAKNSYLKALEIDPDNRGALNNLNEIEREQKEDEYVNSMDTCGKLFQAGQSSALKGKYKLAVKLFSRAFEIEPLLKYAVNLAGAYKKLGKFKSIEDLYLRLVETNKAGADVENINNEFRLLRLNAVELAD
jgi:tetratricopeptide (TPR) repeat protein